MRVIHQTHHGNRGKVQLLCTGVVGEYLTKADDLCRRPRVIKSARISDLEEAEYPYITAITKPQIEALQTDVFQLSMFDGKLVEVTPRALAN